MTEELFLEALKQRIPTPQEFVEFAHLQRWKIEIHGEPPVLFGPKDDPIIRSFAKVLSREPYRTNVLAYLKGRGGNHSPALAKEKSTSEADPEPESIRQTNAAQDVEMCPNCGRGPITVEDRRVLRDMIYCQAKTCPYRRPCGAD